MTTHHPSHITFLGDPQHQGLPQGFPRYLPQGFPSTSSRASPGTAFVGPPSSLGTTTYSPGRTPEFAHRGQACCVGADIQTPPPRSGGTRPHLQPPGLPGAAGTEAHIRSRNLRVRAQTCRQLRPFSLPTESLVVPSSPPPPPPPATPSRPPLLLPARSQRGGRFQILWD